MARAIDQALKQATDKNLTGRAHRIMERALNGMLDAAHDLRELGLSEQAGKLDGLEAFCDERCAVELSALEIKTTARTRGNRRVGSKR